VCLSIKKTYGSGYIYMYLMFVVKRITFNQQDFKNSDRNGNIKPESGPVFP